MENFGAYNLFQLNDFYNSKGSLLDLVFTNNSTISVINSDIWTVNTRSLSFGVKYKLIN